MGQKILGALGAIFVGVLFPVIVYHLTEGQSRVDSDPKPSSPLPSSPLPSSPINSSEPDDSDETVTNIELAKIYSDFSKNYTQAADVYKGMTVNASGFIRADSIYECQFTNNRQIVETARCMRFFSSDGISPPAYGTLGYEYQNLRFSASQTSEAIKINQLLHKTGKPLMIKIQGTISLARNEFYGSGTFVLENWGIISYKQIE